MATGKVALRNASEGELHLLENATTYDTFGECDKS
jgi:hypothetical protein